MELIYRNFSVEDLEEVYDLPYGAISNTEGDEHRWYTIRELVFEAEDGTHWQVNYMDPASEMQEGQDRWINDPMKAFMVEKREVIREEWFPVDGS